MDVLGKLGFVRINIATVEESAADEMNDPHARRRAPAPRTSIRRLLGYARPPSRHVHDRRRRHVAVRGHRWRPSSIFVQKFVKGMTELQFESVTTANPADLLADSDRRAAAVPAARHRRLHVRLYFPGLCRRGRSSRAFARDLFRQYLHLPASYYDRASGGMLLSKLTLQHRAGGRGHHQVHHRDHPRLADHHRADRHDVLPTAGSLARSCFLIAPPLSWLVRKVSSSFRRYSARIQASMGDVTRVVKEALDGQRVIKVFNAQDQEAARLREASTSTTAGAT